jgi:PAS domain S-box-containing protein
MLGYSEQELVGSKIIDFAHSQCAKHWQELQQNLWNKKIPSFSTQACLVKKDGSMIWCRVTSILFKDKDTTLGYTILEDITEQKLYQQKLEELQSLLKQSQEIAQIGSYDMDAQNHTVFATPETYKILGIEGVADTNPWQLFLDSTHPEDRSWVEAAVRKAIETNTLYSVEHRIVQPSGRERWIWSTGKLIQDQDSGSNKSRLIGVIIDVTDRKRSAILENANKRLTVRNDELDSFVYTASHDLRSPVNNMEMLIGYLAKHIKGIQENSTTELYINLLNKSITDLKTTLQDLTTVTEIYPGEKKELVNLKTVLEEVQVSLFKQIEEAQATINVELVIPFLAIPKKHARSLIYNLLSNALKFRSKDRNLIFNISSHLDNDRIHLSFQDNGIGIREADQEKVFMIFKRFNTGVAGRGVGMYLVKRVIDINEGIIYLNSQENVGTTFHIEFPIEH